MASSNLNAVPARAENIKDVSSFKVAVVKAEWNAEITDSLEKACLDVFLKSGIIESNVTRITVPGSFELTSGAQLLFENTSCEAVVCLGCVIQGETRHFDFICQAVANGLSGVSIQYKKPVIFGVLTTNNQDQALERSGGKLGNKGAEAAETALKMIALSRSFMQTKRDIVGFARINTTTQATRED